MTIAIRRRWLLLFLILGFLIYVAPSMAQSDIRVFPETGHSIRGVFRWFWEQNGSTDLFGYPITEEYSGSNGRITQYFERSRFELVQINGVWTVDLGKLGLEVTEFKEYPKAPPTPNTIYRRYIPETQHIIQYGFKEIWETRGSMQIFGYPISEEISEILDDGEWHTVQYFERSRFEYWPNLPSGKRVLISLLGRQLVNVIPSPTSPASPPVPSPDHTKPTASPSVIPSPTVASPSVIPSPTVVPTATPQPSIPKVTGACAQNAPVPHEGAQAWVTDPSPQQNGTETVCARLIVNGRPQSKISAIASIAYSSQPSEYSGVTNDEGVAVIQFRIGRAKIGYSVRVTVKFNTGQSASTSFTPR